MRAYSCLPVAVLGFAAVSMALPAPALAQDIPVTMEGPTAPVTVHGEPTRTLSLRGAYGIAQSINRSVNSDITSGWIGITWRLRGRVLGAETAAGLEFAPAILVHQNPRARAAGWHFLFEQRWSPEAGVHPYAAFGAGMMFSAQEIPRGETRHNFTLFGGGGLELNAGPRTTVRLGYRIHHVSNADAGPRNPGINAHTVVLTLGRRF